MVNGCVVVAGGTPTGSHLDLHSVETFDAVSDRWKYLPPLPHAVSSAMACELNGYLYVAGGWDCDKLQRWDGVAWTVCADLPQKVFNASSVVRNGKIWLIGGMFENEPEDMEDPDDIHTMLDTVFEYDPGMDSWECIYGNELPEPRWDCITLESDDGSILLVGGGGPPLRYTDHDGWNEIPEGTFPGGVEGILWQGCCGALRG